MVIKLFGVSIELRRETTQERLERVIREREVKEATEALLCLADLRNVPMTTTDPDPKWNGGD